METVAPLYHVATKASWVAQVSGWRYHGTTHMWVRVDTTGGCDPAPSVREILEAGQWTRIDVLS